MFSSVKKKAKNAGFCSGNLHRKGRVIIRSFLFQNLLPFSQPCGNNTDDKNLHGMKDHQRKQDNPG